MGTAKSIPNQSLLKSRRYFLFWWASLFSNIGTWMQLVAQPWVMLSISQSAFLVGVDSFAMNAPVWVFTLWGGALADRLDRKKVVLVFQGIQLFAILILVALLAMGLLKPWMIIVISLVVGITDALSTPSFQTIVPSLVERSEIPRAVALNAIQFNLSRTLGPAIAGLMMVQFGALACFGVNALSYIPFFLSIFWIYPRHSSASSSAMPLDSASSVQPPLLSTLLSIAQHNEFRTQLASTFATAFFCGPLITFSSVVVKEALGGQIEQFGAVTTAFGLGGLLGAILTFLVANQLKERSPTFMGLALGVILIAIAINHSPILIMPLMVLAGSLLSMANSTASSNLQTKASRHVRGQYSSLFQLAFRGGLSLGALSTGVISANWGITVALIGNGVLAVVSQGTLLGLYQRSRGTP